MLPADAWWILWAPCIDSDRLSQPIQSVCASVFPKSLCRFPKTVEVKDRIVVGREMGPVTGIAKDRIVVGREMGPVTGIAKDRIVVGREMGPVTGIAKEF